MSEKFLNGERTAELWSKIKECIGNACLAKVPVGAIVIWSGTADNIPTGWQLCDGTNGTPDLRDKFVLGAGTSYSVGDSGGSETVTLTEAQMPKHRHIVVVNSTSGSGSFLVSGASGTGHQNGSPVMYSGGSQPHPNMPPYYTLCYIMKL